jgi:hypothetical protein
MFHETFFVVLISHKIVLLPVYIACQTRPHGLLQLCVKKFEHLEKEVHRADRELLLLLSLLLLQTPTAALSSLTGPPLIGPR